MIPVQEQDGPPVVVMNSALYASVKEAGLLPDPSVYTVVVMDRLPGLKLRMPDPGLVVMVLGWAALLGAWAWIALGGPLP